MLVQSKAIIFAVLGEILVLVIPSVQSILSSGMRRDMFEGGYQGTCLIGQEKTYHTRGKAMSGKYPLNNNLCSIIMPEENKHLYQTSTTANQSYFDTTFVWWVPNISGIYAV